MVNLKTTRHACSYLGISPKTLQKALKESDDWYYDHPDKTWWMKERLSIL